MKDKILNDIQTVDENFQIKDWYSEKYWCIENEKFQTSSLLSKESETDIENINSYLKNLISFEYQRNEYLYKKDRFEIIIGILFHDDELNSISEYSKDFDTPPDTENIYFQISNYSDCLRDRIRERESYQYEFYQTIKIYNINTVTGIDISDERFKGVADFICKSIVFEVEQKYKLVPRFFNPLHDENQGKAAYGKVYEFNPNFFELNKLDYTRYDKDLLSYYYRALWMEESEFKYLAFFQVLECLFDEVFKKELIQDVRVIMESSWFSTQNNSDIQQLISVIEQYNKDKNDKVKTKLVLERYFKSEIHDDAFFLANKDIISILTALNLIQNESSLKDLQKLATIVYDYRCDCTHSNREYPIKPTVESNDENLELFISLIKKIAVRIILNYQ